MSEHISVSGSVPEAGIFLTAGGFGATPTSVQFERRSENASSPSSSTPYL